MSTQERTDLRIAISKYEYGQISMNQLLAVIDAALDSKQAKIDALMLEYCPDEMSEAQLKEWDDAQRAVRP